MNSKYVVFSPGETERQDDEPMFWSNKNLGWGSFPDATVYDKVKGYHLPVPDGLWVSTDGGLAPDVTLDGLSLNVFAGEFSELRWFLNLLCRAGVLRCIAPSRRELCDNAAVSIFWQDQAEYYPCCARHMEEGEQWTGSTRFAPHMARILVIRDKAIEWLISRGQNTREMVVLDFYQRESTDAKGK